MAWGFKSPEAWGESIVGAIRESPGHIFNFPLALIAHLFYNHYGSTHGFYESSAYTAQIGIFRGLPPYLGPVHLAVLGSSAQISPHVRAQQLPCE